MRGGDENSPGDLSVTGKKMPLTPLTPRKAQLQRARPPTQAEEARRQLRLRSAGVSNPVSLIEGMGRRRKTRRGKKAKRRMTKKKW